MPVTASKFDTVVYKGSSQRCTYLRFRVVKASSCTPRRVVDSRRARDSPQAAYPLQVSRLRDLEESSTSRLPYINRILFSRVFLYTAMEQVFLWSIPLLLTTKSCSHNQRSSASRVPTTNWAVNSQTPLRGHRQKSQSACRNSNNA